MAKKGWQKGKFRSDFPGVYYRKHSERKHGVPFDKYFFIRYKLHGKEIEEGLGWASKGMTAQDASDVLSELKRNRKTGVGPVTLREKRELEGAKKESRVREKAEAEKTIIPFSAIWLKYLEQARADGKKSLDREESLYTHWIAPVLGNKPLVEIAPIHLEKIKSNMSKADAAPRSIHYCLAVVRQVFNFAVRHDLFGGANPVSKVKKPTCDNRRMRFLTQDEAEKLLEELTKIGRNTSRRITLLSLHCGLRFGEIAGLTWADIDLDRGAICIRNPKNGRTRFAYMTETLKAELAAMEPGGKADLVFPDRNGGRRKQMSDTFDRAVETLKLNDGIDDPRQRVCFHTCRHSFASWLVEGGTDLFVVREMLGHRDLNMTARYSHLAPGTLQKAVRGLERRLNEQGEKRAAQNESNLITMLSPA